MERPTFGRKLGNSLETTSRKSKGSVLLWPWHRRFLGWCRSHTCCGRGIGAADALVEGGACCVTARSFR